MLLKRGLALVFPSSCGLRLVAWVCMVRVDEVIASDTFHVQEVQTHTDAQAWMGDCLPGLNLPLHDLETSWGLHAEGHHEAADNTAKQPVGFWGCLKPLLSDQQLTSHWHIVFMKKSPGWGYRGGQGGKDGRKVSNDVNLCWHQPLIVTPKTTGKLREEVDLCRGYPGPTNGKGQRGYL